MYDTLLILYCIPDRLCSRSTSRSNATRSLIHQFILLGVPLEFVRPLNDVSVTELTDQPVVLECELSRAPKDKVQWLKDGKPLSRLPAHVRVEEDANGTVHRLIFDKLQDDDLATYSIKADKLTGEARVDMKSESFRRQ